MNDVFQKLKKSILGSGHSETYDTPSGYGVRWVQDSPSVVDKAVTAITEKLGLNKKSTPVTQYSSPTPQPKQATYKAEQTPTTQQYQPTQTPAPTMMATPITSTARNPAVSRYQIPAVVHEAIQKAAKKYDIPASLLYDIALQESSFNPTLKNPLPGSSASGLFQFTDGTWDTLKNYANMPGSTLTDWNSADKLDPYASAQAAAYLIKNGQLGRWNASQGVWGPQYSYEELQPFYSQTMQSEIPTTNWR